MSMFKHSPLASSSIRLIEILPESETEPIRCNLRHAALPGAAFVALSYRWGDWRNAKLIEVDGKLFRVTSNLHFFLTTARKKGTQASFWIDAICIDQDNLLERSEQVKLMGQIYASATEVWVWLGAPLSSSMPASEIFDLSQPNSVRDLCERARIKMGTWRSEGKTEDWIQGVRSICSRPYWRRLWITQEFLNARSVLICIGDGTICESHFQHFLAEIANPAYTFPLRTFRDEIKAEAAWKLCASRSIPFDRKGKWVKSKPKALQNPLEQVLGTYAMAECADWHDRVYGLLSLAENSNLFPVDYSIDKIKMLMTVFAFEDHRKWSLKLTTARLLMRHLHISDSDLLQYTSIQGQAQVPDKTEHWITIPLRPLAVVDRESPDIHKEWKLKQWELRLHGKFKNYDTDKNIVTCRCHKCSANMSLPALQPGDEIRSLLSFRHEPQSKQGKVLALALRPSSSDRSGYQYLGVVSVGSKFLRHSLPPSASEYQIHQHLRRNDTKAGEILLEIDPATMGFLMGSFVAGNAEPVHLAKLPRPVSHHWCSDELSYHLSGVGSGWFLPESGE